MACRHADIEAVIATTRPYRQKIEALGIGFRAVRPDRPDLDRHRTLMRRIMDPRKGSEFVIRELMMPVLRESYEDTLAAAEGADLLVSHVLTFTTRLVAEKKGIPWAALSSSPWASFRLTIRPCCPRSRSWRSCDSSARPFTVSCSGGKAEFPLLGEPWHRLRAEIGLPPTSENPLFEGHYSPSLVLAMFSQLFAGKQPDWPPQTVVTGFPFSDQDDEAGHVP